MDSKTVPVEKEKTLVIDSNGNSPLSGASVMRQLPVKPQNRYHFVRSVGFGGMKGVLLVRDSDTDREVVMAIMPDFRDRPKTDLERFAREAIVTAKLEHPNIVPVHDIGIDHNGMPFFTMKYLRGFSLEHMIAKLRNGDEAMVEKYTIYRRLQLFLRVCNAIDFAHSRGYCHLDIKPGNVNIGDFGEVVVLDWGLASPLDKKGRAQFSGNRQAAGTPGYMPPEYLDKELEKHIGIASDIYSLGALLYALLSLRSPLYNSTKEECIQCTLSGNIPKPSSVAPSGVIVDAALEAVCCKAMARNPEERYQRVTELRKEILSYMSGYAPRAANAGPGRQVLLFLKRNWTTILIVFLAVALSISLLLLLFFLV